MRAPTMILLALLAAAGSWFFFNGVALRGIPSPPYSRTQLGNAPRNTVTARTLPNVASVPGRNPTIRLATFNLQQFGPTKSSKPHVMDMLARILQQFDVVACQEIRSRDQSVLPALMDHINVNGLRYDYVIGPHLGQAARQKEQFAFVFNSETIEVDRTQFYTIDDPDDLIYREPFVGWFRARGPAHDETFTFTLVNVHTDPDRVDQENSVLDGVLRAVRADGRNEDDVIVLGDFNAAGRHLEKTLPHADLTWAIARSVATNTSGTDQFDNIGFTAALTDEFTGRAGAFDFLREFNLTIPQAAEVSDHLPAWAEFHVFEGGIPGRIASRPADMAHGTRDFGDRGP